MMLQSVKKAMWHHLQPLSRFSCNVVRCEKSIEKHSSLAWAVDTAVRPWCHGSYCEPIDQMSSSCWKEELALLAAGPTPCSPELQEGALAGDILVFLSVWEALWTRTAGGMWFLPLFCSTHHTCKRGREVTQPSLRSGNCFSPPQGPDLQFKVVFLSADRAAR